MRLSTPRLLAAAALFAGLCGCGRSDPEPPAAVTGSVTFQGRPLVGGVIVFAPDRDKGNGGKPFTATVGPDGWYRLTADGPDGVTPGWYRVAIADAAAGYDEPGRVRFPAALRRPDRSGIEREVLPGRENVFHFEIEVSQ